MLMNNYLFYIFYNLAALSIKKILLIKNRKYFMNNSHKNELKIYKMNEITILTYPKKRFPGHPSSDCRFLKTQLALMPRIEVDSKNNSMIMIF